MIDNNNNNTRCYTLKKPIPDLETLYETYKNDFIDNCEQILLLKEHDFLKTFYKKMTLAFIEDYGQHIFKDKTFLSNIKVCESRIKLNQYKPMFNLCQNALQSYFLPNNKSTSYPKEYGMLTNFREHCCYNQIPFHTCKERFITVLNPKTPSKPLYVICTKCKLCYYESSILMLCVNCKKEFYSAVITKTEKELPPATFDKYHCNNIMFNAQLTCIKCGDLFWIKNSNLYCKSCKLLINPQDILWNCAHCHKDFHSGIKVYNPLEYKIIKLALRNAMLFKQIVKPKTMPCKCYNDLTKVKFYHKVDCKGVLYYTEINHKNLVVCSLCSVFSTLNRFNWVCPKCKKMFTTKQINIYKSNNEYDVFDKECERERKGNVNVNMTMSMNMNMNMNMSMNVNASTPNAYIQHHVPVQKKHSNNNVLLDKNITIKTGNSNSNIMCNNLLLLDMQHMKFPTNTNNKYNITSSNSTNSSNPLYNSVIPSSSSSSHNDNNNSKKRNYSITLPHQDSKPRKGHSQNHMNTDTNTNNDNNTELNNNNNEEHITPYNTNNTGIKIRIEKSKTNVDNTTNFKNQDRNSILHLGLIHTNTTSSHNIPNVNSQRYTIETEFKDKNGFNQRVSTPGKSTSSERLIKPLTQFGTNINVFRPTQTQTQFFLQRAQTMHKANTKESLSSERKGKIMMHHHTDIPNVLVSDNKTNEPCVVTKEKSKDEYRVCNTQNGEGSNDVEKFPKISKISFNKKMEGKKGKGDGNSGSSGNGNGEQDGCVGESAVNGSNNSDNNNNSNGDSVSGSNVNANTNVNGNNDEIANNNTHYSNKNLNENLRHIQHSSKRNSKNNIQVNNDSHVKGDSNISSSNINNGDIHDNSNPHTNENNEVSNSNIRNNHIVETTPSQSDVQSLNVNENNTTQNTTEVITTGDKQDNVIDNTIETENNTNTNNNKHDTNNNSKPPINNSNNIPEIKQNINQQQHINHNTNNNNTNNTNNTPYSSLTQTTTLTPTPNIHITTPNKPSITTIPPSTISVSPNPTVLPNSHLNIRINTSPGKPSTSQEPIIKSPLTHQKTTPTIQKYINTKTTSKQHQPSSSTSTTPPIQPPPSPQPQPQQQQQQPPDDELKEFNFEEYTIITQLGQGTFGKIYLVRNKHTNHLYSMKKIILSEELDLELIIKEYQLCHKLKHNNIVEILGIFKRQLDITTYVIYILMEVGMSDWEKEIKSHSDKSKPYTEQELLHILTQLVSCLSFLQRQGVSHRDIKPQNVLTFKGGVYKIADFGEAKQIEKISQHRQINTLRGTELYMSPLLYNGLRCNQLDIKHNLFKSDVYSLGLCMLFAATLSVNSIYEIRKMVDMKNIRMFLERLLVKKYSEGFIKLLGDLLELNEMNRPDFVELEKVLHQLHQYQLQHEEGK